MSYVIVYLPTGESIRDILALTSDKELRFYEINLAKRFIDTHNFLLSRRGKAPFAIKLDSTNSYTIGRAFHAIPKYLLEIIEV
jgi:hypothetical protein